MQAEAAPASAEGGGDGSAAAMAPSYEAVLSTVLQVLHGCPGQQKCLRQVSRECRCLADGTVTRLSIPGVATLLQPQPEASAPQQAEDQPGSSGTRACPEALMRLLPRLKGLWEVACSVTPGQLAEDLGSVLGRLSRAAPDVMVGVRSLDLEVRGDEAEASVQIEPALTAAISAALPGVKEIATRSWSEQGALVIVDGAFQPLAHRLTKLELDFYTASALEGAAAAISTCLSGSLRKLLIQARGLEGNMLNMLSACTLLEELDVCEDDVSDFLDLMPPAADGALLLGLTPLAASCKQLRKLRVAAFVTHSEFEPFGNMFSWRPAGEVLEELSSLPCLEEVEVHGLSLRGGQRMGSALQHMQSLRTMCLNGVLHIYQPSKGRWDVEVGWSVKDLQRLIFTSTISSVWNMHLPDIEQLLRSLACPGHLPSPPGESGTSSSPLRGVRIHAQLPPVGSPIEPWLQAAQGLGAVLEMGGCTSLDLVADARAAGGLCVAQAVLTPPLAARLSSLTLWESQPEGQAPTSTGAVVDQLAGLTLPLLTHLFVSVDGWDEETTGERVLGAIARLAAPRLSNIGINTGDGVETPEAALVGLCARRPQPVDAFGCPVRLRVGCHLNAAATARVQRFLQAAGLGGVVEVGPIVF